MAGRRSREQTQASVHRVEKLFAWQMPGSAHSQVTRAQSAVVRQSIMKEGKCWEALSESDVDLSPAALSPAEEKAPPGAQNGDRPAPLSTGPALRLVNGPADTREERGDAETDDMLPRRFPPSRESHYLLPRRTLPTRGTLPLFPDLWPNQREEVLVYEDSPREDQDPHALLYSEPGFREKTAAVDRYAALANRRTENDPADSSEPATEGAQGVIALPLPAPVPAWLNGAGAAGEEWEQSAAEQTLPGHETLQGSRERVASQRFASKTSAVQEIGGTKAAASSAEPSGSHIPLLAVFSLAGGVGKTSLVATLGRALSHLGERVLLVDTTAQGLLPFYFGGGDLRPSVVRSAPSYEPKFGEPKFDGPKSGGQEFAGQEPGGQKRVASKPGADRSGAPVDLVSLDVLEQGEGNAAEWLRGELARAGEQANRILVDTSMPAPWVVRVLAGLNACLLVPVAPDMNSVITLRAVEEFFADLQSDLGQVSQPVYLLNGFDASQPLHLDVRELLRQQLGERLLPFVIRRSQTISDALAEGATVIDFPAASGVVADYLDAARWVQTHAGGMPRLLPPESRWSEG